MALLQDDFWTVLFHDDTACGITADTHNVASRSARIASCFLELEKVNQDLESKLRNDFNNILNSMDKLSLSPTPQPPSPSLDPQTRTVSPIHNSSFTSAAYSWLLENIASPYPSSTVKASLAERYNCTLSSVNTWFVNARRRMGWTVLCRDYFNNCRADTLDAAYRALIDEDPNRPLPPDVIHAFITVKVAAEGLYSSTFTKSALASDLDAVVMDMTDRDAMVPGERKQCASREESELELQNKKLVAQCHYSSPDCSYSSSPVPPLVESLTDESEEEDEEVFPPILAGRKRRLSCSEPAHATTSTPSTKRRKYMRPTCRSVDTRLSSPDQSLESLDTLPHNQELHSTPISQNLMNISRKRSLSYINAAGIPNCQGFSAEPRLHAVSDTLPLSMLESDDSLDGWFKTNFDTLFTLPPPVDVIEPDPSAQWEVQLFSNYNIPPEEPQRLPFKSLIAPIGDQSSPSVLLELDDFLRSLESGGSVAPTEIMNPAINISVADFFVPQDLSLLSESIDWTALLKETSDPSFDSILGQCHTDSLSLPEIDLSILQLP